MRARPKPWVGATLGLLLALTGVALLSVLGVYPAERVLVWGASAVGVLLGGLLLTQRPSLARRRMLVVTVVAGVAASVAVTGASAATQGGAITDGCTLTATSNLEREPVSPSDTTALDPFEVAPDGWIAWEAGSQTVLTDAATSIGLRVGGFDITLWEGAYENTEQVTELSGTELVQRRMSAFYDRFGVPFSGVYRAVGTLDARQGSCETDLYLRVAPETPLSGWLLLGLWAGLAALALALLVLTWDVRSSIRDADAYERAAHGPGDAESAPSGVWPELDEGG